MSLMYKADARHLDFNVVDHTERVSIMLFVCG